MSKKKPETEAAPAEVTTAAETAEPTQDPAAEPAPTPDPAPAEPPTGGLWREVFDLMVAGEPVLIRSALATGRLKSIAAGGVVAVELPDGQDGVLPTVLGDQAAYELVQDVEGAYILRDLGRGRETVGTSSESVKHFYSAVEMAELAREMDDAHQAAQAEAMVLAGLQVKVKEAKGAVEGHMQRASEISQRRRQGWEMREYPCIIVKDYVRGVKEIVREDTGELIKDMALADFERQGSLPLADQSEADGQAEAGETCCHRCGTVTATDAEGFAPEEWKRTPGSDPAEWTCPDCQGVSAGPQEGEEQAAEPGEAAEIAAQAEMVETDGNLPPCEHLDLRAACHPCADAGACPSCCAACLMRANAGAVPAAEFQRPEACQLQEAAA